MRALPIELNVTPLQGKGFADTKASSGQELEERSVRGIDDGEEGGELVPFQGPLVILF